MTVFLVWSTGFGAFMALWFMRGLARTTIERDNARSQATHWEAVAARRLAQLSQAQHDGEMQRREMRLLADLLAESKPRHSPFSRATVDELLGQTVDEEPGPESWGV